MPATKTSATTKTRKTKTGETATTRSAKETAGTQPAKRTARTASTARAKAAATPSTRANLQPLASWPARDWPALASVSRPAGEATAFKRRATTSLTIRGELVYDDAPTLRAALAGLDDHAYVEFYSAANFTIDGLRIHIDLVGELEADCTAIDPGFVALVRPARAGAIVVHAGRAISARRYAAGAYGPTIAVPELPPGAVRRFGAPERRDDRDSGRVWTFPERTWSFDQGFRSSTLRVRDRAGHILGERVTSRAAVDVCADGSAALLLGPEGLEVVDAALATRVRWGIDRDLGNLAISPDGSLVMVVDQYGERLTVRDATSGADLWHCAGGFRDAGDFVRADRLAVAGFLHDHDGEGLFLLDPRTGRTLAFHPHATIRSITPSAGGQTFLVVEDGCVHVYASEDGALQGALDLVEHAGDALERADDGAWRSRDSGASWDGTTGLPRHDHPREIRHLAVARGVLASRDDSGLLILRDESGRVLHRGRPEGVGGMSLRPDGERLVVHAEHCLLVFAPDTGAWSKSRPLGITAAAFAPDGRLWTGHKDGSLRVWPAPEAGPVTSYKVGKRELVALHFSPDGDLVLALGPEGRGSRARLVDARTGAVLCDVACDRYARGAAVTPAGAFVVGTDQGTVLHDRAGARVAVLSAIRPEAAACDREHLVIAVGRLLYIVDPATGERRGVLEGHEDNVTALAWTADRLYSADCRLLAWDLAALRALGWTHPLDPDMVPLP